MLYLPQLVDLTRGSPPTSGAVTVNGIKYLVTFRAMNQSQDWVVGIIVPESFYLRGLESTRDLLVLLSLLVIVAILLGGAMTLQAVQRGLGRILAGTRRMRDFDFAPATTRTIFSDVRAVMESLELTKTAMRAMSKYVPTDLVRQLYEANREPSLGGTLAEVSLLFTDIKDFTRVAENMEPDALAGAGPIFRSDDRCDPPHRRHHRQIHRRQRDGPLERSPAAPGHAAAACRAALACVADIRALYESPEWKSARRETVPTRFGIHTAEVIVGHFGIPIG